MATSEGVKAVIQVLRAAGCKAPEGWAGMQPSQIAASWVVILGDVDDEALMAAAAAWARGGGKEHAFFPTPGQLLGALAPPAGAERDAVAALAVSDCAALERCYHRAGGCYGREPERFGGHDQDQRIRATLTALGGWQALKAAMTAEDGAAMGSYRKRFAEVHRGLSGSWSTPAALALTASESSEAPPVLRIEARPDQRYLRSMLEARQRVAEDPEAEEAARATLRLVRGGR